MTVCVDCEHVRWGKGVVDPSSTPGRPSKGAIRSSCHKGQRVCAKHPRGFTESDAVSGEGDGVLLALFCEDVNRGSCPDFVPVNWITRHFRRSQ